MMRQLMIGTMLAFIASVAWAQEAADSSDVANDTEETVEQGDGIESPKTMSGMSILGNEEAPKSLVIIPWKSSELGDDISLSDTLDDRAKPVDKEVFLRELHFHDIRAGAEQQRDPD